MARHWAEKRREKDENLVTGAHFLGAPEDTQHPRVELIIRQTVQSMNNY